MPFDANWRQNRCNLSERSKSLILAIAFMISLIAQNNCAAFMYTVHACHSSVSPYLIDI